MTPVENGGPTMSGERMLRRLRRLHQEQYHRADTMRGLPNDVDYQRGVSDGVLMALHIAQAEFGGTGDEL